ncbi:MAG: polyvinyl alcohol dehydrogenase [Planctomycetaceae bacterium]|nr:MAG: polyvinyl alcohol dehydrogenase [Planctomycetaceae bacterium]
MLCLRSEMYLLIVLGLWGSGAVVWGSHKVPQHVGWPQWRGPARDNKSDYQGLNKNWEAHPPRLLGRVEGLGKGYASVSLSQNRLFTTGNTGKGQAVICVDLDQRKVAWTQLLTKEDPKHGWDGSRCTPTLDDGLLYVVTSDGSVACLQQDTGDVVWRRDFRDWSGRMMSGWGFSESPLVDGDRVLVTPGGEQAMIVCLNKKDGREIWRTAMKDPGGPGRPGAGYSSIVMSHAAGTKQYVQLVGRGAIGVRADDGHLLWTYQRVANGTANIPTPLTQGDYVFVSTGYKDGGSALLKIQRDQDHFNAEEVYYHPADELQNHHGQMVMVGDYIYMGHGHNRGFPVCVEWKTGKVMWNAARESRNIGDGSAAITFVDGHLIFRYQSGPVALIEATPEEFRFKGAFTPVSVEGMAWSHPVVVAGKLYLRDQNTLMIYDVSAQGSASHNN